MIEAVGRAVSIETETINPIKVIGMNTFYNFEFSWDYGSK